MSTAIFPLTANVFAAHCQSKLDFQTYEIRVGIKPASTVTFFDIVNEDGQSITDQLPSELHKACEEVGIEVPNHLVSLALDRVITRITGVESMLHSTATH